jgi:tRNA A-37 threonylcarbamoyl transferase component Bud32
MARIPKVLDGVYEFEYDIGMWTFGSLAVYKHKATDKLRTCKTVPKSMVGCRGAELGQLRHLTKLSHQHICSVTEALEDKQNFYIMGEFVQGGELSDWAERLDENYIIEETTCAAYIRQAIVAMVHSHSCQIFHGALTPSSLSLSSKMPDAYVKVNDFGLAAIFDPDNAILQRNRSPYTAPEILSGEYAFIDSTADMYSIGAITHALLVGCAPGAADKDSGFFSRMGRGRGRDVEAAWAERSAISRDFVRKLLAPWDERLTAARALQHPFLKEAQPIGAFGNKNAAKDYDNKVMCYLIALLMVPVTLPYRDFEQLQQKYEAADTDNDGLIARLAVRQILRGRCDIKEAVDAAMNIADVHKSDVFDLCSVAVADVIARQFFAAGPTGQQLMGPFESTDLLPRMLKKFFEVFGGRQQTVTLSGLKARLRTATFREVETHALVDYEEMLADFPNGSIDVANLQALLLQNAGRGTPLGQDDENPKKANSKGFFNGGFLTMFQQCMATGSQVREDSPI